MRHSKQGPMKVVLIAALLGAGMTALPVGAHEPTGRVSPPRPVVEIERVGEVTLSGSFAVLKVKVTCLNDEEVYVSGSLWQDNIVGSAGGHRGRYVECEGEPVTEDIIFTNRYSSSRMRPGKALLELSVSLCINDEVYLGCRRVNRDRIIQLELANFPLNLPI